MDDTQDNIKKMYQPLQICFRFIFVFELYPFQNRKHLIPEFCNEGTKCLITSLIFVSVSLKGEKNMSYNTVFV